MKKQNFRHLPWILLAFAVLVIVALLRDRNPQIKNAKVDTTEGIVEQADFDIPRPQKKTEPADDIMDSEVPIEKKLAVWQQLFIDYQSVYASLPTGTREEILAALSGKNPKKIFYISADHPALQLEEYFFHVLARDAIEVRHYGKDRSHFSEDDIVLAPLSSRNPRR